MHEAGRVQQRPHLAWTPALLLLGGLSFLVDIAGIGRALVPAVIASAAAAARSGPRTRASTASTAGATGATSAGATSTGTATARAAAITTGVVTRAMGANQAVDGRRQHHVRGKAMRSERLQKQVPINARRIHTKMRWVTYLNHASGERKLRLGHILTPHLVAWRRDSHACGHDKQRAPRGFDRLGVAATRETFENTSPWRSERISLRRRHYTFYCCGSPRTRAHFTAGDVHAHLQVSHRLDVHHVLVAYSTSTDTAQSFAVATVIDNKQL